MDRQFCTCVKGAALAIRDQGRDIGRRAMAAPPRQNAWRSLPVRRVLEKRDPPFNQANGRHVSDLQLSAGPRRKGDCAHASTLPSNEWLVRS